MDTYTYYSDEINKPLLLIYRKMSVDSRKMMVLESMSSLYGKDDNEMFFEIEKVFSTLSNSQDCLFYTVRNRDRFSVDGIVHFDSSILNLSSLESYHWNVFGYSLSDRNFPNPMLDRQPIS